MPAYQYCVLENASGTFGNQNNLYHPNGRKEKLANGDFVNTVQYANQLVLDGWELVSTNARQMGAALYEHLYFRKPLDTSVNHV